MRGNSKTNLATAVIFCMVIFLPMLGTSFPPLNFAPEINEMRSLKESPPFSFEEISNFPDNYESFFNDHFGFRNGLILLNNLVRLNTFGVSGSPKVVAGKKGWLYYTGNKVIDDYRGINHLSNDDLKQWQTNLESKEAWLASQGIDYLFIVAPNKASVYPEYLPDGILRVSNNSPVDQLVTYLKQHSKVKILDLRDPLIAQKGKGLLFHRTDTHWTTLGAFLAYEQISSYLVNSFPQVTPISLDELNIDMQLQNGGDLATMLGLQKTLKEEVPQISLLNPQSKRIGEVGGIRDPFEMESSNRQLPRAVMFRDSFATALTPYLSENFSYIRYVWERWDKRIPAKQIIFDVKPDIVIEEVVERLIRGMESVSTGQYNLVKQLPPPYAEIKPVAGGAGAFDPADPKLEQEVIFLSGWAIISSEEGILPDNIAIGFQKDNKETFIFPEKKVERKDVASYFKNKNLLLSGFKAQVEKTTFQSADSIILYQLFNGHLYQCCTLKK